MIIAITARMAVGLTLLGMLLPEPGLAARQASLPEFIPPSPYSEFYTDETASPNDAPTIDFCAEWNPEFSLNGHRCCRMPKKAKRVRGRRYRGGSVCYQQRWKPSYCAEMTADQKDYSERVATGGILDALSFLDEEMNKGKEQSYCTVNNGFLAYGRPVVPTALNRIVLRRPERCVAFGTDPMVGMVEWLGRQVAKEYSATEFKKVELLVGDISAPRGGCLPGVNGLRGHASHTSGKDVDLGFIVAKPNKPTPNAFHTQLDATANWPFLKQIFKNPYACVKVIFLDRSHIRKVAKAARGDEDWQKYGRFVRHAKGHKNHYHVRIGDGPGQPGCGPDSHPELETDDDVPLDVEIPEDIDANRALSVKISATKVE